VPKSIDIKHNSLGRSIRAMLCICHFIFPHHYDRGEKCMWAVLGIKIIIIIIIIIMKIFYIWLVSVWKLDYKREPGLSSTTRFP
jgi:hypothetical protein